MAEKEMRGFEDLECYQLAMKVFHEGYRIASHLPPEEKYNLADQLRRAATSAVLNIAEGYGRYHYLDSLRFYYIARGSIMETLSAFIVCDDQQYTKREIAQQRELCHSAVAQWIYPLRSRTTTGKTRIWRTHNSGRTICLRHCRPQD